MKSLIKNSDSETLPVGWKIVSAGEIAEIKLGKMLDRVKHTSGRSLPYLRNINVRWGEFDTTDLREMFFDADEVDRYSVRQGDLVVCEGGEPGRAAIWHGQCPAMFQKALHRVRPGPAVLAEWMLVCLRHYASSGELMRFVSGTTIKHFTREAFTSLPIPLPPLREQRRIVARLEALTARSRRARALLAEVPKQLAQARQSLLASAFRDPSCGKGAWTTALVGDVAEIKLGKMLDQTKHTTGAQLPYLRNINVRWGQIDTSDLREMFFETKEVKRYSIQNGDLVVCEGGEPGRAAIWQGHGNVMFQKALHRVRPFNRVSAEWILMHLMHYAGSGKITPFINGTTIKHFTREAFSKLPIPLPPLPEQREIVRRLQSAFARLDAATAAHATAVAELDRLDQSLLARAFSGGLVAPEPEPKTSSTKTAVSVQAQTYLLRFIPALLRTVGQPVSLPQLSTAVALRFLPASELLPVVERLGSKAARAHFAGSILSYEDGAFVSAIRTLQRTGALALTTDRRGTELISIGTNAPPSTPAVDTDARHLAPLIARVSAQCVAPVMRRLQTDEVREALLTTA